MVTEENEYQRLTRPRSSFGVVTAGRFSLWLGKDHVLCVQNQHFRESYRRFYFQDIQAVILRKTVTGAVWNILLGVVGMGFLIPSSLVALTTGTGIGTIICWSVAGFFLMGLLINTLLGPTCVCQFQTAVQTEEIPSLNRLRKAQRIVARLRPLIEGVQGRLTPEGMAAGIRVEPVAGTAIPATPPPVVRKPPRHEPGRVHEALFYLMLADTVHTGFSLFYHNKVTQGFSVLLFLGYVGLIIGALVKQANSDLTDSVKGVTWSALGYFVVCFLWVSAYGIYFGIEYSSVPFTEALPINYPGYLVMDMTVGAGSLLLGLFGLKRLYEGRRGIGAATPAT